MSEYDLWDEFLKEWPPERVREMSLEEYTKAGSRETFTYWLESRLDKYGSIWGGSSFKFGVYSRADDSPKESNKKRSYTEEYGWYTKDGDNPQTAFEATRDRIVEVIESVGRDDLENIDKIDLGPAYKWKIASHYQDRTNPRVIAIFLHTALAALCNEKPNARAISRYHRTLIGRMPAGSDLLEYSNKLWKDWQRMSGTSEVVSDGDGPPLNVIFYGPPGTGNYVTQLVM